MNTKKIIANVKPYEGIRETFRLDVPFANCAITNDLVVLNAYHMNEFDVLFNVNFVYDFVSHGKQNINNLKLNIIFFEKEESVLERLNIKIIKKSPSIEELISSIKMSIENDRLVLLHIDLFYQKGRDYYYQLQHGPHAILVFGYDDENEIIYTIDNIKGYGVYKVSYDTLRIYCSGLFEYLGFEQGDDYFYEYIKASNESVNCRYSAINSFERYCKKMMKYRFKWKDALENILIYRDRLTKHLPTQNDEKELAEIKYRKASEYFRIKKINNYKVFAEREYKEIDEKIYVILEEWMKLHGIWVYCGLNGNYNKALTKSFPILENIYKNELSYGEIYFNAMERFLNR